MLLCYLLLLLLNHFLVHEIFALDRDVLLRKLCKCARHLNSEQVIELFLTLLDQLVCSPLLNPRLLQPLIEDPRIILKKLDKLIVFIHMPIGDDGDLHDQP